MRNFACTTASVLLVTALFPALPAAGEDYLVRDLGSVGGGMSAGFGLNELGHVVGNSVKFSGHLHSFFWDGAIAAIPPLAGDRQSHAFDLNDAGKVLAESYDLGELQPHGYFWQANVPTALGNFAPRDLAGPVVAGFIVRLDPTFGWMDRPAYWQAGDITELPTLGGHFGYAATANDTGMIAGWTFDVNDLYPIPTRWLSGTALALPTLGGLSGGVYAVNELDLLTGWSETAAGEHHATLWTLNGDAVTDLGVLGNAGYSYAYDVNRHEVVVGTSDGRAFVWENGAMSDLNALIPPDAEWRLDAAWALNERGHITGNGLHRGMPRAFLLTPLKKGDLNCDAIVDFGDINPFVMALSDPLHYEQVYANCDIMNGDVNQDGKVDFGDINPFIKLLTGP